MHGLERLADQLKPSIRSMGENHLRQLCENLGDEEEMMEEFIDCISLQIAEEIIQHCVRRIDNPSQIYERLSFEIEITGLVRINNPPTPDHLYHPQRQRVVDHNFQLIGRNSLERYMNQSATAHWNSIGLNRDDVDELCRILEEKAGFGPSAGGISAKERLVIALSFLRTGESHRELKKNHARSLSTINGAIHDTINAFSTPAMKRYSFRTPRQSDAFHPKYANNNPKRHFWQPSDHEGGEGPVGSIDGTLFKVHPTDPERKQVFYTTRSQCHCFNLLVCVDFSLLVTYILSGCEGSANDQAVFDSAVKDGLDLPNGCCYLADSGYKDSNLTRGPLPHVRYWLSEYRTEDEHGNVVLTNPPTNSSEAYNYEHSGMRMTSERLYGAVQRKFKVMVIGVNEGYSLDFQAKVPVACFAIHNFSTRRRLARQYPAEVLEVGDLQEPEVYRETEAREMNSDQQAALAAYGRSRVARSIWDNRSY